MERKRPDSPLMMLSKEVDKPRASKLMRIPSLPMQPETPSTSAACSTASIADSAGEKLGDRSGEQSGRGGEPWQSDPILGSPFWTELIIKEEFEVKDEPAEWVEEEPITPVKEEPIVDAEVQVKEEVMAENEGEVNEKLQNTSTKKSIKAPKRSVQTRRGYWLDPEKKLVQDRARLFRLANRFGQVSDEPLVGLTPSQQEKVRRIAADRQEKINARQLKRKEKGKGRKSSRQTRRAEQMKTNKLLQRVRIHSNAAAAPARGLMPPPPSFPAALPMGYPPYWHTGEYPMRTPYGPYHFSPQGPRYPAPMCSRGYDPYMPIRGFPMAHHDYVYQHPQ